ncbi:MAG: hypothetical protein ABFD79_00310 [Phycisphaerales bacterium]
MFEAQFEEYIKKCRWFGGKGKSIKDLKIKESISLEDFELHKIEIFYLDSQSELYLLPVAFSEEKPSQGIIAKVEYKGKKGFFYEAVFNQNFRRILLKLIYNNKVILSGESKLSAIAGKKFKLLLKSNKIPLNSTIAQVQQSNTSFFYENVFFLKLFRRLQQGSNPEEQMIRYLTENTTFDKIPAFAGLIKWQSSDCETETIALLQEYVKNKGDAWSYFCENINIFINKALKKSLYTQTQELIDSEFTQNVELLAKRTAQMHLAMAASCDDNEINPEPVTDDYRIYLYESSRNLAQKVFNELNFENSDEFIKDDIAKVISVKDKIFEIIENIKQIKFAGKVIRTHGDYHLGQVLFTGDDFIITDFEGEPTRSFIQRRKKHLALRDISGMIRSFHYASYSPVLNESIKEADSDLIGFWTNQWYQFVSEVFLDSYFNNLSGTDFLPDALEDLEYVLDFYMLEKAIYELDYELHNRPAWLIAAANGILHIINKKIGIHHFNKDVFKHPIVK